MPCKEVLVDCSLASPSTMRGRVHQGALRRMRQVVYARVLVRSLPPPYPALLFECRNAVARRSSLLVRVSQAEQTTSNARS